MKLCGEPLPALFEQRLDRPVFDWIECTNLALTLDDESQRDRLYATCRDTLLHCLPQDGARLVSHKTIEDATSLLRLDLLVVDGAGLPNRELDRILGDLVKEHAP